MACTNVPLLAGLLAFLAVASLVASARATFTESYCSSQNTAADNTYYNWHFQSNGNCSNHCNQQSTFAFAVLQFDDCWCSNYIPSKQTSTSNCDKACPGFPSENCGSKDDNLFLYVQLGGQPSGTAGGSQPSSAAPSSTPSPSPPPSPPPSSPAQSPAPASSAVKPSAKPPPSQQTSFIQPQTSLAVMTESGVVITRTILQTPTGGSDSTTSVPVPPGNNNNGPNIGAIVGGVLGGVLAIVAIVGGVLFCLWRRRRRQRQIHDELNAAGIGGGSSGITRNTSTMSSAGLLGRGTSGNAQQSLGVATNLNASNSRLDEVDSNSPGSNRRNSQPLVVDSRLNPKAVLTFAHSDASRDSLVSMDDSRDYGRQLNVRNPDP